MLTNFCSLGSKSSRAGLISFSGSLVSTVVLVMAMYLPYAGPHCVQRKSCRRRYLTSG